MRPIACRVQEYMMLAWMLDVGWWMVDGWMDNNVTPARMDANPSQASPFVNPVSASCEAQPPCE